MGKSIHFTGQPIFNQLLFLIPRSVVKRLARHHNADRYSKTFKSYDHLVTMLFSTFHRCTSLREVITGMQAHSSRLRHLGIKNSPRRSTLSDANRRRPAAFFEDLYHHLYNIHYNTLPDSLKGKKAFERLFIIDSTTISLFSQALHGAGNYNTNGKKKGGIKAHMLVRAKDDIPCFVRLTEGKQNDLKFLPFVNLPRHSIVVMDKAYRNYAQMIRWTESNITWITRINQKAAYRILEKKILSPEQRKSGIKKDLLIELGSLQLKRIHPFQKLRLIIFYDKESKKHYEFLTNDFRSNATTIAGLYKKRWQIELLFKRIKQNFYLHQFLGDSENAIRIQLWCTLIADLLIKIIKDKTDKKRKWSMANLTGLIRLHLSTYINLKAFITNPQKALLNYKETTSPQLKLFIT